MQLGDMTITVDGTLDAVWQKLIHWETMHEWDIFMDRVQFDGPLKQGSVGKLKMKNGPEVTLIVTRFSPPNSYTDEFSLAGSLFVFHHELTELRPTSVSLRIWVEARGMIASLLAPFMRKQFSAKMPLLMNNFKQQFEVNNRVPPFICAS
jgi:hypothetical protein